MFAVAPMSATAGEKAGKCFNVNSCKGTSACATATSAAVLARIPAQGQGWVKRTKTDCEGQRVVNSKPKLYFSADSKNAPTSSVHFFCLLDTISYRSTLYSPASMTLSPRTKPFLGFGLGSARGALPGHSRTQAEEHRLARNHQRKLHGRWRQAALLSSMQFARTTRWSCMVCRCRWAATDELDFDYLETIEGFDRTRLNHAGFPIISAGPGSTTRTCTTYLPLPYTEEAIVITSPTAYARVQDFIGRQMLIENLSSYITLL